MKIRKLKPTIIKALIKKINQDKFIDKNRSMTNDNCARIIICFVLFSFISCILMHLIWKIRVLCEDNILSSDSTAYVYAVCTYQYIYKWLVLIIM